MTTTSARLLALLSLLQARRDWPGPLLAQRLGVSARTVRRDVDRLRELGYPIAAAKGPDGGYRLDAGSHLPPMLFDDEQAIAITVALQLATTSGVGTEEAAIRALNTLRQVMPARLRRRIDTLTITAISRPTTRSNPSVDSATLAILADAIHAREEVRFVYVAPSPPHELNDQHGASPPRRVQPHHVVTWGGRWYLVGWDLDRAAWRTFRVDRITPRTPTGPRFTPREIPGGDVARFVASTFRGATQPGTAWPCQGQVILDLPAIEVTTYTSDGVVEDLGPRQCRLSLGSWSWPSLAAAIARFDADFEVIGPAELTNAVGQLARRYTRASGSLGDSELTQDHRPT